MYLLETGVAVIDKEQYAELVRSVRHGKKLPDAVYLHKSALKEVPAELSLFLGRVAAALKVEDKDWDLLKLQKNAFRVSFLSYPTFYVESYPPLKKSTSVDLSKLEHKVTNYEDRDNPPILHRKELFVLPDDPHYQTFCDITVEGEQAGLYENAFRIGFKHSWERLIHSLGYELVDGRLMRASAVGQVEASAIDRHKTAIVRYELSGPMKSLAKHGYLNGEFSVFDYGCGRGDDLRELEAHGIDAVGWDPNFRPDVDKEPADLVNLGFVLNVIEDIDERMEALQSAFSLAKKLLVVSAMIAGDSVIAQYPAYKDGVITSRNTFQKYYNQSELQAFIERVLQEDAIAIGPGIFYVFADKMEEQAFLSRRQKRHHQWRQLTTRQEVAESKVQLLLVQHKELLDHFWQQCLEFGRVPANDEFEQSEQLRGTIGSHLKAFRLLQQHADVSEFDEAQKFRKEDLLVYFALSLFGKRKPYSHMPERMKRDIKAFFSSYNSVTEEARELLFSVANPDLINQCCEEAHKALPASVLNPQRSLVFHERYLSQLPIVLRIYVGCAAQLYGDLEEIDLIKVHIKSGKVSFMNYREFDSTPLPLLVERVKVKLRDQDVDYFDYVGQYTPPPLYWKARYIDASFDYFDKQQSFDKKLAKFDFIDPSKEFGPSKSELDLQLRQQGKEVRGYRFYTVK